MFVSPSNIKSSSIESLSVNGGLNQAIVKYVGNDNLTCTLVLTSADLPSCSHLTSRALVSGLTPTASKIPTFSVTLSDVIVGGFAPLHTHSFYPFFMPTTKAFCADLLGRTFDEDELLDIARYGCSGGVSGFIYSSELYDVFSKYEDEKSWTTSKSLPKVATVHLPSNDCRAS